MAGRTSDSQILDYFEAAMKGLIIRIFSDTEGWWDRRVPHRVREEAAQRHRQASSMNDVLNKPAYGMIDYINFDGYERIIVRRDNWREYFERIFLVKQVFDYKIRVVQSLRNDIRHGRRLDAVNRIRLRLHCYDMLSQIHEAGLLDADGGTLVERCGLDGLVHSDDGAGARIL